MQLILIKVYNWKNSDQQRWHPNHWLIVDFQ